MFSYAFRSSTVIRLGVTTARSIMNFLYFRLAVVVPLLRVRLEVINSVNMHMRPVGTE